MSSRSSSRRHPRARPSEDEERALIRRVAAQDRAAFEELYRCYYPRLFNFLFKVTSRTELVEEVLNDVMLLVWQRAGSFDGRSRLSSWILGIAYRKALKALKRASPRAEHGLESEARELRSALCAEREADQNELAERIGRALALLPPEQRAAVELTYFEGFTYREIAEITGRPLNTVKTRMYLARRRLRELLPDRGDRRG